MPRRKRNLVALPRLLASITRIDSASECAPEDLGLRRDAIDAIWSAAGALYRTGAHQALTINIRRHGKVIMNRSIGHVRGNEPEGGAGEATLASPETPICLFSASKAISGLLVHKLVEMGKLELDEPVSRYIPEYGQKGKERTTVRQLLSHRAGIPAVPSKNRDYRIMYDWDAAVAMLCAAKPYNVTGERQAYHAITGGFILGELIRRASGLSLQQALYQWLAEPLGCKYMTFGIAPEYRDIAARNVFTGPRPPWFLDWAAKRVLGANFREVVRVSNEAGFLSCPIPSVNIFATADEAGRVFQMLLNGGEFEGRRVFAKETVAELIKPMGSRQFDGMLGLPVRFCAGLMLGDNPVGMFGRKSRHAFGHLGFLNIVCWADPDRDISVAILNNGKSLAPNSLARTARLIDAVCMQTQA